MSTPMTKNLLVKNVMMNLDKVPVVPATMFLKEALEQMGNHRLGIACVVDADKKLLGILTDGDIRRKLITVQKPFSAFFVDDAIDHAIKNPTTAKPDDTLAAAVRVMGSKQIWDLPVTDEKGVLVGLLHLHPAVEALLSDQ